jgi:hypothetical protein
MKQLVQVVPALPPRFEGIGGYAVALARALRLLGVETTFVCSQAGDVDFATTTFEQPPMQGPTLVHYANYGYAPNGLPSAFVTWVERSTLREHVTTFFHEFVATGPPWRRSFWSAASQRRLAKRMAAASARALTTLPIYSRMLAELCPDLAVQTMAMPSPIGEPASLKPPSERSPVAVVFGGAGNRRAVYDLLSKAGPGLAPIDAILDIGPEPRVAPRRVGDLAVVEMGALPDSDVSRILVDCRLGFSAYPPDFGGKSTAFAALAAHGVPCSALRPAKFAVSDVPFLASNLAPTIQDLDRCAREVLDWYRGHAMQVHARRVMETL